MRSIFCHLLRVRIVDSFLSGYLPEVLQQQVSSGISVGSFSTFLLACHCVLDKINERLVPTDINSIILWQHDIIGCQDSASLFSSKLLPLFVLSL